MTKNWYDDGICFSCTACGSCCGGAPGYVWVNKMERQRMADALDIELEAFEKKYCRMHGRRYSLIEKANYDCIFLEEGKCTLYEARPEQCKTFPFWKSALRDKATFDEVTEDCPGTGCGKLWDKATIEKIAEGSPI